MPPPRKKRPLRTAVGRPEMQSVDQILKVAADRISEDVPGRGKNLNLDSYFRSGAKHRITDKLLKDNGVLPQHLQAREDAESPRVEAETLASLNREASELTGLWGEITLIATALRCLPSVEPFQVVQLSRLYHRKWSPSKQTYAWIRRWTRQQTESFARTIEEAMRPPNTETFSRLRIAPWIGTTKASQRRTNSSPSFPRNPHKLRFFAHRRRIQTPGSHPLGGSRYLHFPGFDSRRPVPILLDSQFIRTGNLKSE